MNQVVQTIAAHRSIRRFQTKPLPADVRTTLLECALRAPTTAMGHFYSIVEIKDPALRQGLYELSGGQQSVLHGSFFVFALDVRRASTWAHHLGVKRQIGGFTALIYATIDAMLAAQNLSLAAESLGLGTVFIGMVGHRACEVCELLDLPPEVLPIVGLVVGYPAEDPPLRPRIPLAFMHHVDRYRDMQPSEIAKVVAAISDFWADDGFVEGILTGDWWTEGEESLEKALIRQAMRPA